MKTSQFMSGCKH